MNNDEYKQHVLGALDEIAVNSRIEVALASRDADIRAGQSIYCIRKARRRAHFLSKLQMVHGSKWLPNGRCTCGEDHCAIELHKGDKLVDTICPYTYWHRICALLIEERSGSEMYEWTQSHKRNHFVRPITE